MSHTPGPWYYHFAAWVGEESEDGDYHGAFGITNRSKEEFQADGQRGDLVAYVPWDCDHVANARLMACAPEMLDALRLAADALDLAQAQVDSENDRYNLCKRLVAVKRVIAKAEGSE